MNLSVHLLEIAFRAVQDAGREDRGEYYAHLAALQAVVFAWAAIEALLNELAYIEIHDYGRGSKLVYDAVERGAQGFERVQAILTYLYGRALDDGSHPANDLKHLIRLRNGLVHYKFRDERVVTTLTDLVQRGYLTAPSHPWDQMPMAWATQVKPSLAQWALYTACDTGIAIAGLMPDDEDRRDEAQIVRANFRRQERA